MNFADLQELLRLELVRRIEMGLLTGTRLAQQTGFRQAHISNFLNRKRALSLEGLDRVLEAQNLSVDQILPIGLDSQKRAAAPSSKSSLNSDSSRTTARRWSAHGAITASASRPASPSQQHDPVNIEGAAPELLDVSAAEQVHSVPLVSPSVAMGHPRISPAAILDSIPIAASQLPDGHQRRSSLRQLWQRFVAIHVDAQQAAAMTPMLPAGAVAVLDRHAISPVSSTRSAEPAVFAVRSGPGLLLRLIELDDDHLILRPLSGSIPVQLIPISQEHPPADYLVGRVILLLTTL